jgi:subtilisin family serine protease
MTSRKTLSLLLSILALSLPALAGELVSTGDPAVPNSYIVLFKAGVAAPPGNDAGLSVAAQAGGLAQFHGGRVGRLYENALQGFVLHGDERVARAVAADQRVAEVVPNYYYSPAATQASPVWGLDRIDERDLPRNNHFTYSSSGSGVNIYILDSGVNSDADLGTRKVNAFSAITDASGVPQYNDCNGHGTSVAKLAAGTSGGVAKAAKIHNVRIGSACAADCGVGGDGGGVGGPRLLSTGACGYLLEDLLAGMDWVRVNRVRPAVANMSFGGPTNSAMDTAVRNLYNAGVVVVASAGNNGGDACLLSPGRVAEALTIGASDINDARAIYSSSQSSNTGSCIDLWAPGKDLNGFSGTSASAPIVAGAAAVYLQTNTAASPATVASTLIGNSTTGKLTGIGSSANRLLFVPPGGTETDQSPSPGTFTCTCNGTFTCTMNSDRNYSDDFAVVNGRYLVDYDNWNRPIWRYGYGPVSYTFKYAGPYLIEFTVQDDGGQWAPSTLKFCQ